METDKELSEFVDFVRKNAYSLNDIGKKAVRSTPEYYRLRKRYTNIDDLIVTIYDKSDILQMFLAWIRAEWEIRRLKTMHEVRLSDKYNSDYIFEAAFLIKQFREKYPEFMKRLEFKFKGSALVLMAVEECKKHPWLFSDVVKASDAKQGLQRAEGFYEKLEERERKALGDDSDGA